MDITKDNIAEEYDTIIQNINNCSYFSIDLELTGISPNKKVDPCDFPDIMYLKIREAANKYNIIQLGLTLFNTKNDPLTILPYNFYLFKDSHNEKIKNDITFEIGAIEFNKKYNMNFNKWIYDGVPYWNKADKKKLKELIFSEYNNKLNKVNEFGAAPEIFDSEIKKKLDSQINDLNNFIKYSDSSIRTFKYDKVYQKAYIITQLVNKHLLEITTKDKDTVQITKITEEQYKEKLETLKQFALKSYKSKTYFNNIFKALKDSKKAVIIHNGFIDLAFIYSHFVEKLPESYLKYKLSINSIFNQIFDTKIVQEINELSINNCYKRSLGSLFNYFYEKNKNILIQINHSKLTFTFEEYINKKELHNAAYDSCITGLVFYYIMKNYDNSKVNKCKNIVRIFNHSYCNMNLNSENDLVKKHHQLLYDIINVKTINNINGLIDLIRTYSKSIGNFMYNKESFTNKCDKLEVFFLINIEEKSIKHKIDILNNEIFKKFNFMLKLKDFYNYNYL